MSIRTRLTLEVAKRVLPRKHFVTNFKNNKIKTHDYPTYLTFDDGPHPDSTPKLLEQISMLNIKATFFVIGKHAQQYPHLVRQILSEGHSLGTHTWSHWSARKVPVIRWINDVKRARREVEDITGKSCHLFRPPYGELTPSSLVALTLAGFHTIHWSQDTKDYACTSKTRFCQWFVDNKPTQGTVVLMHDGPTLTYENLYEGCSYWQQNTDFLAIPM